jgi:hypothetical protein
MFVLQNKKSTDHSLAGSRSAQRATAVVVDDNRPQAISQRMLQSIAASSLRTQHVAQLATSISHTTEKFAIGHNRSLDLGKRMDAILDPNDPVKGSAPGNGTAESALNAAVRSPAFVPTLERTHLLHHDLGGFGVNANLYPMTGLANRQHENTVESKILKVLHNERKPVNYSVNVRSNGERSVAALQGGGQTAFDCQASYHNDGRNIVNASIVSSPGSNNPGKPIDELGQPLPANKLSGEWKFGDFKSYTVPHAWIHHDNVNATQYGWAKKQGEDSAERKGEVGHSLGNYQQSGKISVWNDQYIQTELLRLIQMLRTDVNVRYAQSQNLPQMLQTVNSLINESDFSLDAIKQRSHEHFAKTPPDGVDREQSFRFAYEEIFFWPLRTLESLEETFFLKEVRNKPSGETQGSETSKMDESEY